MRQEQVTLLGMILGTLRWSDGPCGLNLTEMW